MTRRLSGLVYRKLDLHVHTPTSPCFEDKSVTAADIVSQALAAGLDGIAVTDHNSGASVDDVKKAARGTGLTVFPGAEIHCAGGEAGIHVIALLDPSRGTKDIESLLSKAGLSPGQYGDPEALAKSAEQVVDIIEGVGGIAVLAHANSSKGALADMKGQQRAKLFGLPSLRAVEVTESDFRKAKGKRAIDFLSGSDNAYGNRFLAVYVASDNPALGDDGTSSGRHCLSGVGRAYSYFKTEEVPTIEALRQCFIDPAVRIRLPKTVVPGTPEEVEPYPRIVSITANDGFLEGQTFEFHSGLNTVVGPKGSGKSLLVELLRFALDSESSVPEIVADQRSKLEKRLGVHGEVKVELADRTGSTQVIARTYHPGDGHPYSEPTMLDVAHDFGVLFLSQGEMVRIAEDPGRQMAFLDAFFDFREFAAEAERLEGELCKVDQELAVAIGNQKAVRAAERRVKALTQRIKQLDKALKDKAFRDYFAQQERVAAAKRLCACIEGDISTLETARDDLNLLPPAVVPDSMVKDPPLQRARDIAGESRARTAKALEDAATKARADLTRAQKERDLVATVFEKARAAYLRKAHELGGNQKTLAAEREKKQGELEGEESKLARLKRSAGGAKDTAKRRNGLLDELEDVREAYSKARRDLCARITGESGGKVRVSVTEEGNRDVFRARLVDLKKGSYVSAVDIDAIVQGTTPRRLIGATLSFDFRTEDRDKPLQTIADSTGVDLATVRKLAEYLLDSRTPKELLALQYEAAPTDRPSIEVRVGEGDYAPIDEVSTGQKCTGLVVIALSATDAPVVIDQPEDALDISSIWNDTCQTLRARKEYQQFVVTSHSSNLAVASDTDLYSVLAADAARAEIVECGALDGQDVRMQVLTLLEGGRQAYEMKSKKYGIKP